jgi:hypothetical protein
MSIERDPIVYLSKEFINNMRIQMGMLPDNRTQEDIERDLRRSIADNGVVDARELLTLAERNYNQAVERAQEAWKS